MVPRPVHLRGHVGHVVPRPVHLGGHGGHFLSFCSVKGPELINMYVGQSEENVREGEFSHVAPTTPLHAHLTSPPQSSLGHKVLPPASSSLMSWTPLHPTVESLGTREA